MGCRWLLGLNRCWRWFLLSVGGVVMIEQSLINSIKLKLNKDLEVENELVCSLVDSYISLIEQNAELHKELARLKSERVLMNNDGKPYAENPPKNLAM